MNINKILSKLFYWIWKSHGDYQNDAAVNEYGTDAAHEQKRVPVMHRKCGGQVGWYLGDNPRPGDAFASNRFIRIDGTHPQYGSNFNEKCPSCGEKVDSPLGLKRLSPDPLI